MSAEAVRASGVERRFGATRVLRGVDLTLAPEERVVILGPNGSGKTTLLRVLAGLLRPSAGEVRVLGVPPQDPRARSRVGVVGHVPILYARLTALENLRFWAGMYGVAEARAGAATLLERLGIDPGDRRTVGAYSQGMRQRVALARALVHSPEVLLLDEPFAGLDETGAEAAALLVGEHARAVVVASHQAEGAAGLAHRVLRLESGRLHEPAGMR